MSAIFGVLARGGEAVERAQLARMDSALARHGSDASGMRVAGPAGLAHRLSCFTAEDHLESQPLGALDGELWMVMDGRVDNRAELARGLGIGADEARSMPDSAFALRAYARWEERFLEHLVGEFAVAVWDARKRTLLLGCPAPVARPLYYHASAQLFAFASRPSGLFALSHIEREIDEDRIAAFLTRIPAGRHRSFYRDVNRLLPGQLLTVNAAGPTVSDWWQPGRIAEIRLRRDEDYIAAFDDLLQSVIGAHLRAVHPVGISVSGGLDSSSVAAAAAYQLNRDGKRLAAYTEVPAPGFDGVLVGGRYADETPFVRALAAMHPNIDLKLVRAGDQGVLADADRFLAAAEVPVRNPSNRAWIEAIYERAQADGVRVLLTGEQGNLTISYSGLGLLPALLRHRRIARAVREAHALARTGAMRSTARAIVGQGVRPLLPMAVNDIIDRVRDPRPAHFETPWAAHSLINPEFAIERGLADRIDRQRERIMRYPGSDTRAARLTALGTAVLGADTSAGYRSLFGVDMRTPLADRRLVEFCLALPEEQYAGGGQTRRLIRRSMADRLPPQILDNQRRGLQAADWAQQVERDRERLLTEVASFAQDALVSRVIDLRRLRELLEHWPRDVDPARVALYRGGVGVALMTGRFLMWVQATT